MGSYLYIVDPVTDIHPPGRWIVHSISEIRTLYGGGYCITTENFYAIHLIDNHGQIYTAQFDQSTTTWECWLELTPDESYAHPLPRCMIDFCKKFERYPFNAGPLITPARGPYVSPPSSAIRDLAEQLKQKEELPCETDSSLP